MPRPIAVETDADGAVVIHTAGGGRTRPAGTSGRAARTLTSALRSAFVPAGPLPPDYASYQLYDSLQALCSYIRGVAASAAVLKGLGVGAADATALGATAAWLLRDAVGMAASLALASAAGPGLDADAKAWRLTADVANDAGLALDLASPLLPRPAFPVAVAAGAVARALTGVAGGATRAALTAHFAASTGSAADVAAKEGTQETAVTLVGMALGWGLARGGEAAPMAAAAAFAALTVLHVWLNVLALRALTLTHLNRGRAALVWRAFVAGGRVPAPAAVAAVESLAPPPLARGPPVVLGATLTSVAGAAGVPVSALVAAAPAGGAYVCAAERGSGAPPPHRALVALAAAASPADTLRAYCHALCLTGVCGPDVTAAPDAADAVDAAWPRFEAAATAAGWDLGRTALAAGGARFELGGARKRD